jgi:hypothetical protein
MTEINKDNLEKALENFSQKKENFKQPLMSKEIEIGFHQGALNTLANERNELFKMVQNVEIVMQAHIKRLKELGIKIKDKE